MLCQSCSITQATDTCNLQRSARLLVQNTEEPTQKIRLMPFSHVHTKELLSTITPFLNITTASERDILLGFIEPNKVVNLTYDKMDFKVTDLHL